MNNTYRGFTKEQLFADLAGILLTQCNAEMMDDITSVVCSMLSGYSGDITEAIKTVKKYEQTLMQ